jgi:hypothetical protein
MEQTNTLDFLLQVEAAASALVADAQEEADRRIHDNDVHTRTVYEERCKEEIKAQELLQLKHHENIKNDYKNKLDAYRQELLQIEVNNERFSALINEYLDMG